MTSQAKILKAEILDARVRGPEAERVRKAAFEPVARAERAARVAQAEAEALLHRAQVEAEAVLARGRAEADRIRADLEAEVRAEADARLAAGEIALRAEAVEMRRQAADRLVRLATTLAEQVLDQEIAARPEAVLALARKGLSEVSWSRQATLRLAPEDAARLKEAYPGLWGATEGGGELTVVADPGLSRGDCLVETETGVVDGSVRVQLRALEAAVLPAGEAAAGTEAAPRGTP